MAYVMPAPVYVDPFLIDLRDILSPIDVVETPPTIGSNITLSYPPVIFWDKYFWNTGNWVAGYEPTVLQFAGQVAEDITEWFADAQKKFEDWNLTRRAQFFLRGKTLYTNIPADQFLSSTYSVTYKYITAGVRVKIVERTNSTNPSEIGPGVDSYTVIFSGNRIGSPTAPIGQFARTIVPGGEVG